MDESKDFQLSKYLFPPSEFSPGYFWVMLDTVDVNLLKSQLHDMARHGARSVCLHPEPPNFRPALERSCLDLDYLSPEYFKAIGELVDEAEKLGMNFWLYDEGGWPSGGACGRVWALDPVAYTRNLLMKTPEGRVVVPQTDRQPNYPDLLNREVTDHFLEFTHERFHKYCGEHFGKAIRFAFTDEPNSTYTRPGQLTWTPRMPEEFKKRHGYELEPFLDALLEAPADDEDASITKARIDYYDTWSQLMVENYLIPLRDWCREHGICSSGHMNGEDLPISNATNGFGNILRCMRAMDAPGTDVIWRQLFPGVRTHVFMKYAQSAARQNGSPYAMAECMAIYGSGCTPAETRWVLEHQVVRGATLLVISLYTSSTRNWFVSLAHPRYGQEDTLWKYSRQFHDYFGRLCYIMACGESAGVSALVYYPIRDIWAGASAQSRAIEQHERISETLLKHQIDFDFADDDALEAAEIQVEDGKAWLRVGKMRYGAVVLPNVWWMTDAAKAKLQEFRQSGGIVLGESDVDELKPVVGVFPATDALRVSKRVWEGGSATFLVNQEAEPLEADIVLYGDNQQPVLCNLEDGKLLAYPYEESADGCKVHISLGKWESALFLTGVEAQETWRGSGELLETVPVEGKWRFRRLNAHVAGEARYEVEHIDEPAQTIELGDWRSVAGDWFSGDCEYSTVFENEYTGKTLLDLGQVNYACAVYLNGDCVGQRIWAPYVFDLTGYIRQGSNSLRIVVTNTMANAVNDPVRREKNDSRYNYKRSEFDDFYGQFEPASYPSGLFGPVRLLRYSF